MVVQTNALPLCLISNKPSLVLQADKAKIARIMIDLEVMGKAKRQVRKNLFIANHKEKDIPVIKKTLTSAKIMVRVNSLHAESKKEIDQVISAGADIVMLPNFQNAMQVQTFVDYVANRASISLLLETKEALQNIHSILSINGIDEIHVGLNDLCLSLGNITIFDVIINGTLEKLSHIISEKNIEFGFGGVAPVSIKNYPINPELIIAEQMRLRSRLAIFSRSSSNLLEAEDCKENISNLLSEIESTAFRWKNATQRQYDQNRETLITQVNNWKKLL